MLDSITPVLLTYNEAPNVARTLEPLRWARDVVVVDSGSTDETVALCRRLPQARVFERPFDDFARQWNFALRETGIRTDWVLAFDADYLASGAFVEELRALSPPAGVDGYRARFDYAVLGRSLRGTLYPPVTVLVRRDAAVYHQDGHCYRVSVPGRVLPLLARLTHDDRKPLGRWLQSQDRYMRDEVAKLSTTPWSGLGWADRLRLLCLPAPVLALAWALLVKRGILDGRAGLFYAWQRTLAESLLALRLLERRLSR
jgi:glycosyltransferase involved in cell wall biosynthesis